MTNWQRVVGTIFGFFVFILLLLAYVWGSEQAVNSIEYPLGFIELTKGKTEYGKPIDFTPPDGVSKIISAVMTIQGDFSSDNVVYATVNRQPCDPPSWKVSAKSATESISGYKMAFDCTNALLEEKSGVQDAKFSMDFPAKNVNALYKITYYNEPKVTLEDINKKIDTIGSNQSTLENINKIVSEPKTSVKLSGTEYQAGDNGTVFLQLLSDDKQPINTALCYLDIYTPSKTTLVDNASMMYMLNSDGLYYYDMTIPNATGVYMLSAFCRFSFNLTYSTSSQDTYIISSGNTTNYGNQSYMVVGEIIVSPAMMYSLVQFNLSSLSAGTVNNALLYLYKSGGLGSNLVVNIQRITASWNETNVTWSNQPSANSLIWATSIMNGTGWQSWNITDLMRSWLNGTYTNYGLLLNYSRPTTTNWNFSSYYTREYGGDYVPKLMLVYETTEYITEIRGSGELHVSPPQINASEIWSYSNRTLTDYNQSGIFGYLISINNTVYYLNQSQYQQFQTMNTKLDSINSTLTYMTALIQNISINLTGVTDLISSVNASIFSKLFLMQGDLADILNSTQSTYNLVGQVNQSISSQLLALGIQLNDLDSLINAVNQSIYSKLILIQGDLVSINDTILSTNESISNEIAELLNSLTEQLMNVTNVTLNLTVDMKNVAYETWELFFARGTPPVLPSTTYFCKDNMTLIKEIEYNYTGGIAQGYFNKQEEIPCEYGCDSINAQCNYATWQRTLIVIFIVLVIAIFIYYLIRRSSGGGYA